MKREANQPQEQINSIIQDISGFKRNYGRVETHMCQQNVLNEMLLALNKAECDQALQIILRYTGEYLGVSRVLLFEDCADQTACKAVYEWCDEGIASLSQSGAYTLHYLKDMPELAADLHTKGMGVIHSGKIPVHCSDALKKRDALASVMFTVHTGKERYGFICFDECCVARKWQQDTLAFMKTVSKLVSSALMRKISSQELQSYHETMKMALDHIPSCLCVMDTETKRVVFANKTYRRFFKNREQCAKAFVLNALQRYEESQAAAKDKPQRPFYCEIELEQENCWLGVHCADIQWIDGSNMCLLSGQDVTEMKQNEEYIQYMAYMDHLTDLPNRYRCNIELKKAIQLTEGNDQKGYVLFIDMDDFKVINDGYGHDYGDALLIAFSNYLKYMCKLPNQVFRQGGDEFVILIDPADAGSVQDYIDSLLKRVRQPWRVMDRSFYCTASIGIVAFEGGRMGVKEVMRNADIAMYEAKKIGKNNYAFYNDRVRNDSIERAEIERMLRECIDDHFRGFSAHFQPFVDTFTGEINGAEALIRWKAPNGMDIQPDKFIPLAEYLGLIVPIGEFMLRKAAKVLNRIHDAGYKDFMISVNMSMRQLQQQDIVARIQRILDETGAAPSRMIFEITEGLAATSLPRIQMICTLLHGMGIKISMDDFGTGHSSLSNLRDMPIDIIKIDRSFIQKISVDAYSNSFIRLITEFGHSVQKQICIEGVETADQLGYCRTAGVDNIQGFYFYKPMPQEELLQLLKIE
ncbi:MAG: EAL domain-containing protein [Christensenellales bacterium]|jgi:diguanylate cyclase (GGDEF)-like protein